MSFNRKMRDRIAALEDQNGRLAAELKRTRTYAQLLEKQFKKTRRLPWWKALFIQDWYGWTITCLGCGDSWADGEMLPRPFKPRWRTESIAEARQRYKELMERAAA